MGGDVTVEEIDSLGGWVKGGCLYLHIRVAVQNRGGCIR